MSQVPTGHKTLQRSTRCCDRAHYVATCNVTAPSSYTHSSCSSFPTMHLITQLFTLQFSGWASSSLSAFTADHWNSPHTAPDLSDVQFSPAVTEMQPFPSGNDDTQLTGLVGLIFLQSHEHADNKCHKQDWETPVFKCGRGVLDQPKAGESLSLSECQDTQQCLRWRNSLASPYPKQQTYNNMDHARSTENEEEGRKTHRAPCLSGNRRVTFPLAGS